MTETTQTPRPVTGSARSLTLWADRRILWLSKHWLMAFNIFFLIYVGLPVLAPILLANGYTGAANFIYTLYRAACHQFPSHSYFILGEQVAFCQRDVAIYGSLLLGGLAFGLVRHRLKPLQLRYYVFFLVPIAVDGGMQLSSGLLGSGVSIMTLWIIGLMALGVTMAILNSQRYLTWHNIFFFVWGPLALIYLSFYPDYVSNWLQRTLTSFIFSFGTIWFVYPYMEESFRDIHQELVAKLTRASGVDASVGGR
jgi:uncharacterized membrane protein